MIIQYWWYTKFALNENQYANMSLYFTTSWNHNNITSFCALNFTLKSSGRIRSILFVRKHFIIVNRYVLQCVAMCCNVLQCVAMCCNVLQCVAMCCNVLQCVAMCCNVLQCVAMCCNVL